jgi:hypothetical protein
MVAEKKKIKDQESKYKKLWIVLLIVGLFFIVLSAIILGEEDNSNTYPYETTDSSDIGGTFMSIGFISALIGLYMLFGKKMRAVTGTYDLDDYVLTYGAYKYVTHKKDKDSKNKSKIKDFAEKHPILTGAVAYSTYNKISKIKKDSKKSKQENKIEIIDDLKEINEITILTTNKKKDQIIKEMSSISNIKITSLQPLIIEVNSENTFKILDILKTKKIKYKNIKKGEVIK